jgi:DNA-binding transcriptional ArsR family regulator
MEFDCCSFFRAVADPTRIQIMKLLSGKEMCVTDICKNFAMTQPSISHHLSILKNAKIVKDRKQGKEKYYSLNKICVSSCCSNFMGYFEKEE